MILWTTVVLGLTASILGLKDDADGGVAGGGVEDGNVGGGVAPTILRKRLGGKLIRTVSFCSLAFPGSGEEVAGGVFGGGFGGEGGTGAAILQ